MQVRINDIIIIIKQGFANIVHSVLLPSIQFESMKENAGCIMKDPTLYLMMMMMMMMVVMTMTMVMVMTMTMVMVMAIGILSSFRNDFIHGFGMLDCMCNVVRK